MSLLNALGWEDGEPDLERRFRCPRLAILACFVYALADPSLPQLHDAATRAREIAWPFGVVIPPLVLFLAQRGRSYPWRVDAILALPFALDAVGNVLNLYHSWSQYDTMNHAVSWFALATLVSLIPAIRTLPRWADAALALGAGALGAVLWELGEYAAFIHSSNYTRAAYTDTLSDLCAGVVGASCAAFLVFRSALERRVGLCRATPCKPQPTVIPRAVRAVVRGTRALDDIF